MKVNRYWNHVALHGITLRRETVTHAGIETTRRIIFYDDKFYQVEQIFGTIIDCYEIDVE